MKKEVSLKQVEANRANALKSTGPKTPEGKKVVGQNARTHGIFADLVILGCDAAENPEEFQELLDGLIADYQPVGTIENSLVEEIASCLWRLRRVRRAEVGEIRKRADTMEFDSVISTNADVHAVMQYSFDGDPYPTLMQSSHGVFQLIALLEGAIGLVKDKGYLSDNEIDSLRHFFGDSWDSVTTLSRLYAGLAQGTFHSSDAENDLTPEQCKATLIRHLKAQVNRLQMMRRALMEKEALNAESEALVHSVPPEKELRKLTRYETTLTNHLYKAMNALRKQQSYRLGKAVPEININI